MTSTEQQRIGRTIDESEQVWQERRQAPEGAPNIVTIVLDDVGFAHYSSFGSSVRTPNIDRLAGEGLRYTNFHTSAMCSPTRAALLTGRNPHSVGFGHITERAAGFPGYSTRLPDSAVTVAEILRDSGYSTRAVGKWHLTPSYETGPQGPFERWPLGRGFERYYGFISASTDQFAPYLVRDNTTLASPGVRAGSRAGTGPAAESGSESEEYHLSADLVDEAIAQLRDLRGLAPAKPFFLYLAFGAGHAPHQAPREWIERYRGAFDHGWDEERERILARQIELGIVPEGTELGRSNPGVQSWDSLSDDERRLFARMMEIFAGFVSYTDAQIGRLLDFLDAAGMSENTVVLLVADNGASGEGGPDGSIDEGVYAYGPGARNAEAALEHIDELGGPRFYNHYPWGWAQAGNTPFRWYKQFTHAGGITNGLFIRWPREIPAGGIRRQYHHAIDVTPTLLDLVGVEPPATARGVTQQPLHGVSMRYSFADEDAEGHRHTQHYEMWGNRGLYQDGWMAVCRLQPDTAGAVPPAPVPPFDELRWELYDHRTDPTENVDLAAAEPARLRALTEQWWALAGKYDALPVDTRMRLARWPVNPPQPEGAEPGRTTYLGAGGPYERGVAPQIAARSFAARAEVTVPAGGATGVLYTLGAKHGGYCWYLDGESLCFEVATSSVSTHTVAAPIELSEGRHSLELLVVVGDRLQGQVRLLLDGEPLGEGEVAAVVRWLPMGSSRTYVGSAPSGTAAGRFEPPYPFSGTIERFTVTTDVDGEGRPFEELVAAVLREQ